jgi:hypothetical protein
MCSVSAAFQAVHNPFWDTFFTNYTDYAALSSKIASNYSYVKDTVEANIEVSSDVCWGVWVRILSAL